MFISDLYRQYQMFLSSSTVRYLLIIGILTTILALLFSRFPTLSVGGTSIRTGF
jgi:hypothetical protein